VTGVQTCALPISRREYLLNKSEPLKTMKMAVAISKKFRATNAQNNGRSVG